MRISPHSAEPGPAGWPIRFHDRAVGLVSGLKRRADHRATRSQTRRMSTTIERKGMSRHRAAPFGVEPTFAASRGHDRSRGFPNPKSLSKLCKSRLEVPPISSSGLEKLARTFHGFANRVSRVKFLK